MKRIILATLLFGLAILAIGCSKLQLPFLEKNETPAQGSVEIKYDVEQVILTKGYQNTEPRVELVQNSNEIRLLVYPGLLKSAGVKVKDIIKDGSKITIHLINQDNPNSELVIPQISVLLSNARPSVLTDVAFSIVNENYTPIRISYGIVDVLNKLKADMKISSNRNPDIRLIEDGGKFIWEILYENIFDTGNKEVPLINLKASVDSQTGELLMSSKSLISSLVDEGRILSLDQEYGLLYVNNLPGEKGSYESCLWGYDLNSGNRKFLYGTSHAIDAAEFSPDGKNIYFLENDGTHKILYVLQLSDFKALKIALPGEFTPVKATWKNSGELYVSEFSVLNKTRILLYRLSDNSLETAYTFEFDMLTFIISEDNVAIAQRDGENKNRKILVSEKNGPFNFVGTGWNVISLDNGQIAFLKHEQSTDINNLVVFDPSDSEKSFKITRNFSVVYPIDSGELLLLERINGGNDFRVSLLDTITKEEHYLGISSSDKVLLHNDTGLLFVDLFIPFQSEMTEIIYTVSIDKLK